MLRALVVGLTTVSLVLGPAVTSMSEAKAEPQIEDMGTFERVARIVGGGALVTGAVLTTSVGGYVLTGAVMGGVVAVVGATAAPAVVAALIIGGLGFGTYHLVKGIIGKKKVDDGRAGVNSGRNDRTTPVTPGGAPAGSPSRVITGGRDAAGTPR